LIPLLEVDPDLGRGLDPKDLLHARRLTVGVRRTLAAGAWDATGVDGADESPFAALVVDGLMTRECLVADAVNAEILGPGDVIDAWSAHLRMMPAEVVWTAVTPVTLALLERRFLAAARTWPALTLCLCERALEQNARALRHAAINALRRVDQRILAILWHLATLYGKVRPDGVLVPMRLSHEALGRMIGARRSTVTLALNALDEQRLVTTDGGSGFLLSTDSRAILTPPQLPVPTHNGSGITLSAPIRPSRRRLDLASMPPIELPVNGKPAA
jgi:CRP/FNR family transcriptional regulator, cyclic AMP receptor protein